MGINFKQGFVLLKTNKRLVLNGLPLCVEHDYCIDNISTENNKVISFTFHKQTNKITPVKSVEITGEGTSEVIINQYEVTSHRVHILNDNYIVIESVGGNLIELLKQKVFLNVALTVPKFDVGKLIEKFIAIGEPDHYIKVHYHNATKNKNFDLFTLESIKTHIPDIKNGKVFSFEFSNYKDAMEMIHIYFYDTFNTILLNVKDAENHLLEFLCVYE